MLSGARLTHVPYRGGGQVVTDLLGGQIEVAFLALGLAIEHIKTGKILVLGVTTAKRSVAAPELPAVAEVVPGYDFGTWFGFGAPKETPVAIVARLNAEINAFLADAATQSRLLAFGGEAFGGTAEAFGRFLIEQTEKKGKVVKAAGLKVE